MARAKMKSRARGANRYSGLEGQSCYRLVPASVETESSSPLGSQSSPRQVERSCRLSLDFNSQFVVTSRNGSSRTQTAHAMRASLFARAMVALL